MQIFNIFIYVLNLFKILFCHKDLSYTYSYKINILPRIKYLPKQRTINININQRSTRSFITLMPSKSLHQPSFFLEEKDQ